MGLSDKNYRIVYESHDSDSGIITPPELKDEIEELYIKANKGKPSVKGKLDKLIKRYPKLPFLRNYLLKWYNVNGQDEAASRVNEELLRLFPDYIFAITYKIGRFLERGDVDGATNFLAGRWDIDAIYPERKAFHLSEFRASTSMIVEYFCATGKFDEAEERIALLDEAEVDHSYAETLQMSVMRARLKAGRIKMEDFRDMEIDAIQVEDCTYPQREVLMKPLSPDFGFLYNKLWQIDEALLRDRLENNRAELVAEVEHIFRTALEGYEYIMESDDLDASWSPAVMHAGLIAPYINDEIDPLMLDLLRQPFEFCEFWLGDWKNEIFAAYFNSFSEDKLKLLTDFVLEPLSNSSSKNMLLELLPAFALSNPDSRDTIVNSLRTIFEYFVAHYDDETLFDSTVLAFAVGAAIDLKAVTLMDAIEEMYAKNMVSLMVQGDIDEVWDHMTRKEGRVSACFFDDIFGKLRDLKRQMDRVHTPYVPQNTPADAGFFDEEDDFGIEDMEVVPRPPVNIYANASKNAPCPCGSGKKYKRCHGL